MVSFIKKIKNNILQSDSMTVIFIAVIGGLLIWSRCERKRAIKYQEEKTRLEIENTYLDSRNKELTEHNKKLLDTNQYFRNEYKDSIINAINNMSKQELKDLFSKYRYSMRNSR